jgi:monoamine oxidase
VTTINRRTFVRRASAGLTALAIAPPPMRISLGTRARKIVVVGAGMAGLGAALELVALGHDVTVLEARTRPGGRVFTMRESFADGLYADAGAMQVYDSHTRAQRYVKQFELELDPIRSTAPGSLIHVMGHRIATRAGEPPQWPFALNGDEQKLTSGGLYAKYVTPHLKAVLAADAQGRLLAEFGKHDRMTFSDFLRSQGASDAAVRILNIGLPIGLGDGGDHHSALNLLREAAYRSLRTQSFTIRGGTDRLPKALASRLGERIHYGAPVTRIEQDANGVRVTAAPRGSARTFTADRVIVAVPFAVLSRVQFTPALSRDARDAIEQLPNTSVVKVFIQTRTRFWIADGQSGGASTDLPLSLVSERTINQPGSRGILEAYVVGAAARRVCPMAQEDRLRTVMADLARLFPAIADHYEAGTSKCWDEDEWSRGAYAWFKPGQMTRFLPTLGKAEGRVHFAGDHTSPTPGWMEGALHSAERVVKEIAEL